MKKMLALLLAAVMVMGIGTTALAAVNITINRDDTTYEEGGTEESGNRIYTYYQIFRATESENHTSTGGEYDADGTPGPVTSTPETGITYYLDASTDTTQINQLGSWDDTAKTWTKKVASGDDTTGNLWFKLTKSADGTRYTVEWDNVNSDTDTVQAAAQWLKKYYTDLAHDTMTAAADGKSWTASDLSEGYYLLQGDSGSNLIAATADITVNEKNSYPTVDKKQKDSAAGTYADTPINVKVGDTIYYQIEVKVPADANIDIVVTDTMSAGLTYDTTADPAVKVGETSLTADITTEPVATNDYVIVTKEAQKLEIKIHPTSNTKGKTVVITYPATVNDTALTQTDRMNTAEIAYGNSTYTQTDIVEYDIGAAAIIKYDAATATLDTSSNTLSKKDGADAIKYLEATFSLTDANGNAVNVKEATAGTKGVYVVAKDATTNTVTSDKNHNGVILIYGLDPDVTYTLTETVTEDGYNLLAGTASLTAVKAERQSGETIANTTKVTVTEAAEIVAGNASAGEENTLVLTAEQVKKIENKSGSVLPSTGGIGTTIFYIIGAILVIGAGMFLVIRKRMSAN